MTSGLLLIADEYARQANEEGFTLEHDYIHNKDGELACGAAAYASAELYRRTTSEGYSSTPHIWPWREDIFKPTPDDRIRELVKAGALIVAEIRRIQLENERNK